MSEYARKVLGRKRTFIAAIVSAGIIVVLMLKAGVRAEKVAEQLRSVHWGVLVLAIVFSAAWHLFVGADKWWRILRGLGAQVPYGEVFRVRLGSDPIRFTAPFKVGEVVNAAYFARIPSFGFSRAAGSITFDKALNFFGALFWLYVGMVSLASVPPAGRLVLHTSMGVAIVLLFTVRFLRDLATKLAEWIHPKLGRLMRGVLSAFEEFSPGRKIGFLGYGIVFQLRPLIVCYLLFLAFNPARMPSLQEFLAYGSVVVLMSNVPLTVAGIGPREAALTTLFATYASDVTLLSVGILMSFSIHVVPAILGIPFMFPLLRALAAASPGEARVTAPRRAEGATPIPEPVDQSVER